MKNKNEKEARRRSRESVALRRIKKTYAEYKDEVGESTKAYPKKLKVRFSGVDVSYTSTTDRCVVQRCQNKMQQQLLVCYKHQTAKMGTRNASRRYSDYDYWNKLTPENKAWLREFDRKYYQGSTAEPIKVKFTPKQRTQTFSENNARQRSIDPARTTTITPENPFGSLSPEDAYIELIDIKKKLND